MRPNDTIYPHMPRPRIQPGGEKHLRQVPPTEVPDIEKQPLKYVALALVHLRNAFTKVPAMLQDYSKPFDEYNPQTLVLEAEGTITLQATYETNERVESILIIGPAAATVTLQLGDRTWPLIIPATGFLFMGAPLGVYLDRTDLRQLTAGVAGNFFLELMGHADSRGLLT